MYDELTNHENILKERYVISVSWKWLDEKKVHSVSVLDNPKLFKKDPNNDLHVVSTFCNVLTTADVIVGHNSDSFDLRMLEGRALYHGLSPLPPITSIDTLKVAKRRFRFNCNRLDYIGQFLGLGKKIKTSNDLWLRVLRGDRAAIQEMVKYNKQDVVLLEKVFLKFRPYCDSYVNRQLLGATEGCPRCGSKHIQSRGTHKAISRVYQRFQCQKCGGWFRLVVNDREIKPTTRVL
jgi:predicted RNA-binding Zn-ribbon protein involved in translation (DUF1610 family)